MNLSETATLLGFAAAFALGALLARAHAGSLRRAFELQSERPVELHD